MTLRIQSAVPRLGGGRLPRLEAVTRATRNPAKPAPLRFDGAGNSRASEARHKNARAIFIDKDGTLVEDVPHNVDPTRMHFRADAHDALQRLSAARYRLFIVSNQPGIALGRFRAEDLARLAAALIERLHAAGIAIEAFYACPHASAPHSLACCCRKPAPGLLQIAALNHGVDLAASWMIGDILDDVEAGMRAGTRTILLDVGNETEWRSSPWRCPTAAVTSLAAAADTVLDADRTKAAIDARARAWRA